MRDRFDKCSAHNGHSELAQRLKIRTRVESEKYFSLRTDRIYNYVGAERGLSGN